MATILFTFAASETKDSRKNKIRASGIQNMIDILSGATALGGTTKKSSEETRFNAACTAVSLGNVTGIEFHAAIWHAVSRDKSINDKASAFEKRVTTAIAAKAGSAEKPKADTVRNAAHAGAYACALFEAGKLGTYDPAAKLAIGKRIIAGETLESAIDAVAKAKAEKPAKGKADTAKPGTTAKVEVAKDGDKVKQATARAAMAEKETARVLQTVKSVQSAIGEAMGTLGNSTLSPELRIKKAMELLAAFLPASATK